MNKHLTTIALICALVSSGCTILSPDHFTLSNGLYTMDSSIKKNGVKRDYGGSSQCRITINDNNIRIEPFDQTTNAWFEGTLTGQQIILTVKHQNPDPMFEAMQLRQVFEGQVTADNSAQGTMKGYAGSNIYLNGTWRLTKTK